MVWSTSSLIFSLSWHWLWILFIFSSIPSNSHGSPALNGSTVRSSAGLSQVFFNSFLTSFRLRSSIAAIDTANSRAWRTMRPSFILLLYIALARLIGSVRGAMCVSRVFPKEAETTSINYSKWPLKQWSYVCRSAFVVPASYCQLGAESQTPMCCLTCRSTLLCPLRSDHWCGEGRFWTDPSFEIQSFLLPLSLLRFLVCHCTFWPCTTAHWMPGVPLRTNSKFSQSDWFPYHSTGASGWATGCCLGPLSRQKVEGHCKSYSSSFCKSLQAINSRIFDYI